MRSTHSAAFFLTTRRTRWSLLRDRLNRPPLEYSVVLLLKAHQRSAIRKGIEMKSDPLLFPLLHPKLDHVPKGVHARRMRSRKLENCTNDFTAAYLFGLPDKLPNDLPCRKVHAIKLHEELLHFPRVVLREVRA